MGRFGAGTGNFTLALRDLLPTDATIYAVDRDARAIAYQREIARMLTAGATIVPIHADATTSLNLPPLDGVLMANMLHFVRDQAELLSRVHTMIIPNGTLLVVEYDAIQRGPWLPYPVGSATATVHGQSVATSPFSVYLPLVQGDGGDQTTPTPTLGGDIYANPGDVLAIRREVIWLVNEYRVANGCPAATENPILMSAAQE